MFLEIGVDRVFVAEQAAPARDELNRTKALARELSRLTGAPLVEPLALESPISKRRLANGVGGLVPIETTVVGTLAPWSGSRQR